MSLASLSPRARRAVALSAWLVATLLVALALRAVGWRETLDAASRASLPWLAVASACHLGVVALWAWQTWLLLPAAVRARFGRVFEVQAITATAQNTIPAFLGQATGVAVLAERGGAGTAAALSVLAQHSLIEALAKLATLAVAAQVAPLPAWMRRAVALLAAPAVPGRRLLEWQASAGLPRELAGARRDSADAAQRRALDALRAQNTALRWFAADELGPLAPRVRAPALVLHGATDRQVPVAHADTLAATLRAGGNRAVALRVLAGVDHLLLDDPVGAPAGYASLPSRAVSPRVLGALADWLAAALRAR
ncbi:lysylphosphatidylglycerol synthase domain-containing protein [Roseisolibacter sp. H3M3-2]|uniref:lysylphosphatidylglycerol synthase domain-containing protein n=1 Tax=Roseisolibacter sp. H3M3-2 TaxID=3031323 RepID=UPI0023DC51F0|nr:lysylphosphatidylglycerol synthase domain-containing protein [Roseisolibacter sp. H3M3-2]MDF1503613.1 lysylphosphatidylglycerol synthase domain-containing protein [Roseisolibacter sp. H3M3-2]